MIVLVVREMDRAATELHTTSDRCFMNMMPIHSSPAKRRNQGRVDIEYSTGKVVRNLQQAEIACHQDEIDLPVSQLLKYGIA